MSYLLKLAGTATAGLTVSYFLLKRFAAGGVFRDEVNLTGKNFLVTGGTAGIGLQTAKELLKRGASVTITGRTQEKCKNAVKQIKTETGSEKVDFVTLDLGSIKNIREVATIVSNKDQKLDCLINNAGAMYGQKTLSQDGYEATFAANHLGTFLLTNLLLPKIKESKGRIVVLASGLHYRPSQFLVEKSELLTPEGKYDGWYTYSLSKLANVLFVKGLQKRIQGSGVDVFAVHPGVIVTEFQRNANHGWLKEFVFNFAISLFGKTHLQGSQTTLYAACSPSLQGKGGEYLADCAPKKPNTLALNEELADQLWEFSEQYTK